MFCAYLSWISEKKSKKWHFLICCLSLLVRRAVIAARASARTQAVIDRRDFAWFSKTKKHLKTNIFLDQLVLSKDKKGDYSEKYAKKMHKKAIRDKSRNFPPETDFLTHCRNKTIHQTRSGIVAFERRLKIILIWLVWRMWVIIQRH